MDKHLQQQPHETKRSAVEQVWKHRRSGRELVRPYGTMAFTPIYDTPAIKAYRDAPAEFNVRDTKRKPAEFAIERRLARKVPAWDSVTETYVPGSFNWVKAEVRCKTLEKARNFCRGEANYRVVVRNARGMFEPE